MSAATVAVVLPDLAVGGLQAMAVGLAAALDRGRFRCRFYTFDAQGPLAARVDDLGFPRHHRPRGEGVSPGYAAGLARQFQQDGVDLVHCHNVTALFHGARAARLAGRLPVLFTEHDREMPAPWRHRLLHRWLARRVHRVAVVSAGLAEDLIRYEGFPRARTAALVNGIPDPQQEAGTDRAAARASLGWDGRPVALAVGSLTEVKNHAGLIDAWAELPKSLGARLAIAGEGPLHDGLAARAAALPGGAVELLGRRDDVPRLLAAADVFVLPSHREGLSLSLVEAHAMARPSVAYDVGGNGEVLVHESTGLLVTYPGRGVPAGKAHTGAHAGAHTVAHTESLGGALARLLGDPATALRFGSAARARYLARFTHERMVRQYVALYDDLLAVGAA